MAEYQKIEYRIGKDGKIVETVVDGIAGAHCTKVTEEIEQAMGEVESQEFLPDYYRESNILTQTETQSQSLEQQG
ncbi:DUF2997 domain-containing protein [Spirulina subsalsa FACHB-351]|uniref:DUF2997 domain-containing protein n=2 Tax=Spirulina subsalsa TaxID=54311 RepID=A0ABT3L2E0_9CYAN|nr:DUF2997 domain-containing protein [Spirulina subsalsa FACHB-351]